MLRAARGFMQARVSKNTVTFDCYHSFFPLNPYRPTLHFSFSIYLKYFKFLLFKMGLKLLAIFALLDLAVVAVSTAVPGRGAKPSVSDEVMANRKVKRQAKRRWQRKQLQEDEKKLKDEPAPMWETSSYMLQYGPPRSATTLQFMTMCASSCLKHGPATACLFVPQKGLSETSKICKWLLPEPKHK